MSAYRVRIDLTPHSTLWLAAVTEPAVLTSDVAKARKVRNEVNVRQYVSEWKATLPLLGLEGLVYPEPYETTYPVTLWLAPEGTHYVCDVCGRQAWRGEPTGCAPCQAALLEGK